MNLEAEPKPNIIKLEFGDVREKSIKTPNDFVSHMLEHIAWRLGTSIELDWQNENWQELGIELGKKIKEFEPLVREASALGMIDDGSAEVAINLNSSGLKISSSGAVNKKWFLGSRCEQIDSGDPLIKLAEGLSQGLETGIRIYIGNVDDQHHTWEGIYRAIGICLNKIFTPQEEKKMLEERMKADENIDTNCSQGEISVLKRSVNCAEVQRGTAESGVTVKIDMNQTEQETWNIEIADSIKPCVENIQKLFEILSSAMGISLSVDFKAKVLSSSHVVLEDIGLVMGKAILEIMKLRMERYGINGAGSNLQKSSDVEEKNVKAGISVEGRKFWKFIPQDGDTEKLKKNFLIGQDVLGLRSEDLDDFIDGLAGGLNASVMMHVENYDDPEKAWLETFKALGSALKEALEPNPYRKGVPPGVKATLA